MAEPLIRRRYEVMRTFALVGVVMGALTGAVLGVVDETGLAGSTFRGGVIGLLTGAAAGPIEVVLLPRWTRRFRFVALNIVHIVAYVVVISGSLVAVNTVSATIAGPETMTQAFLGYVLVPAFARDALVAASLSVVLVLLLQVRRLLNPGELSALLTGRYHYPVEETRIFLFADLRGSTTLAEQLGHLRFSAFLRDFFTDLSAPVLAWRGHVYQYEGDGLIISWRDRSGLRDAACVRCFFDMARRLRERDTFYMERYGATPRLTGGLHGGPVVTTWVGELKKELAHHGDAVNAAARIQGLCREHGAHLLTSGWVLERITLPGEIESDAKGEVLLRGKTVPTTLFALGDGTDAG